jgi:hypothetical protein
MRGFWRIFIICQAAQSFSISADRTRFASFINRSARHWYRSCVRGVPARAGGDGAGGVLWESGFSVAGQSWADGLPLK